MMYSYPHRNLKVAHTTFKIKKSKIKFQYIHKR